MSNTENQSEQTGELEFSKLSRNVKEEHLREICSTYGSVKDVVIRRDAKTNISRGTATVVFHKESDAEQAMCYLDGCQIDGGIVKVSYVLVSAKRNRELSDAVRDSRRGRSSERTTGSAVIRGGRDRSPARGSQRNSNTAGAGSHYGPGDRRGRSPDNRRPAAATASRYVPKERDTGSNNSSNSRFGSRRDDSRDRQGRGARSRSRDGRPAAAGINNNNNNRGGRGRSPVRRDSRGAGGPGRAGRSWSRSRTRSRSPARGGRDRERRGRRSPSRSSSRCYSSRSSSSSSNSEARRNRRRRRSSSGSRSSRSSGSSSSRSSSRSSYSSRSTSSYSRSRSRSPVNKK